MSLTIQPTTFREAAAFVRTHHRHHGAPQGYIVAIAACRDDQVVGVAMLGRPVARALDDGWTAEVIRLCTDGTPQAASMLYARIRRVAQQLGYRRVLTYILAQEPGTSLRAAGWKPKYVTPGGGWDRPRRRRFTASPTGPKQLWEAPD